MSKPLNSKVIKGFVPEPRSRKCFSSFKIPMFYVIYVMNSLCTFHIAISGNGTLLLVTVLRVFHTTVS